MQGAAPPSMGGGCHTTNHHSIDLSCRLTPSQPQYRRCLHARTCGSHSQLAANCLTCHRQQRSRRLSVGRFCPEHLGTKSRHKQGVQCQAQKTSAHDEKRFATGSGSSACGSLFTFTHGLSPALCSVCSRKDVDGQIAWLAIPVKCC